MITVRRTRNDHALQSVLDPRLITEIKPDLAKRTLTVVERQVYVFHIPETPPPRENGLSANHRHSVTVWADGFHDARQRACQHYNAVCRQYVFRAALESLHANTLQWQDFNRPVRPAAPPPAYDDPPSPPGGEGVVTRTLNFLMMALSPLSAASHMDPLQSGRLSSRSTPNLLHIQHHVDLVARRPVTPVSRKGKEPATHSDLMEWQCAENGVPWLDDWALPPNEPRVVPDGGDTPGKAGMRKWWPWSKGHEPTPESLLLPEALLDVAELESRAGTPCHLGVPRTSTSVSSTSSDLASEPIAMQAVSVSMEPYRKADHILEETTTMYT